MPTTTQQQSQRRIISQSTPNRTLISSSRIHTGRPGAYLIEPSAGGGNSVFRVGVPDGVSQGEEFQVFAGNRVVRVRCPANARPGHFLQITVPPDPSISALSRANLTSAGGEGLSPPSNTTSDNYTTPGVMIDGQPNAQGQQGYLVPIPAGVVGNQFPIFINSQQLLVTIPPNAQEGMLVRIYAPIRSVDRPTSPEPEPVSNNQTQMFEVIVPSGVKPNQPFALLAGGQRVLVTCPSNARPGQRIRFQLPMALLQPHSQKRESNPQPPSLQYKKHGWARTIRLNDFKFQWVRMKDDGVSINTSTKFDIRTSAYVRQLTFHPGKDYRMRTGLLRFVAASQSVVDSNVKDEFQQKREIISYYDLTSIQNKSLEEKTTWFYNVCRNRLGIPWDEGHVRINIRRDYLLEDSMQSIMSLSRKDLRRVWRFEFINEAGVDAGGLAREWFELITKEVFNPDRGLWVASTSNQMCLLINPTSGLAAEEHLIYFRFLGRVLGKALFDQQLVSYHMVRYMYKDLLGWPISFEDLQYVDEEYYNNLKKIWDLPDEDLTNMCLDFTTIEKAFGNTKHIDLIPNGSNVEVSKENISEYLEACFQFKLLGQIRPQLTELLLGFYDVVPEPLLTIFDFQELELVMCGVPEIDIGDWRENTEYSGLLTKRDKVVIWFWEVVEELDREMKARLLVSLFLVCVLF